METLTATAVLGNSQRLDGGAMFGNAPKAVWSRWAAADDANRIGLACRCLLVRGGGATVLLETGVGAFFPPHLRQRYGVERSEHALLANLAKLGVEPDDVDAIVLSHLHFDHAGGLLTPWSDGEAPRLAFPRARFIVGRGAWQRACHPHPRDRASFIGSIQQLLEDSGRLVLVDAPGLIGTAAPGGTTIGDVLGSAYRAVVSDGHTPGMMLTEVDVDGSPMVFVADLIPGTAWVHLPITMGYDRYPERLIDEKQSLLRRVVDQGMRLFYTHDPDVAWSGVELDDKGRYRATGCR